MVGIDGCDKRRREQSDQKESFAQDLKERLQAYVFDIVGIIHEVYKELPNGMPEYIYQEALAMAFDQAGIQCQKSVEHLSANLCKKIHYTYLT